jgi:hypothetical protein
MLFTAPPLNTQHYVTMMLFTAPPSGGAVNNIIVT